MKNPFRKKSENSLYKPMRYYEKQSHPIKIELVQPEPDYDLYADADRLQTLYVEYIGISDFIEKELNRLETILTDPNETEKSLDKARNKKLQLLNKKASILIKLQAIERQREQIYKKWNS